MKSKRNLMSVLVGLAILATPIAAAAKDHHHDAANSSHSSSFHASSAPARSFASRVGTVDEYRNQGAVVHPGFVAARPAFDAAHPGWNRGYAYNHPAYYGNRPYYAGAPAYYGAPGYTYGAPAYASGYGGGRSCQQARSIMSTYENDRYRGHPAAAADVLRQNQWAFRSGCGSAASAAMGGGLLNGFRGFGAAAPNYGAGYGQPYGGGYGQPYGGGLGGILQQFVR